LEGAICFDWTRLGGESWTVIKNGLVINVSWETVPISLTDQKVLDKLTLEVIGEGKAKVFRTERISKLIFPQEFLELVDKNGKFEFLGWFNNFDLEQPVEKAERPSRPITLLRKS